MRIFFVIAVIAFFLSENGFSQQNDNFTTDYQIAIQYYRNGEFDKAAEVFDKLYYTNRSINYFRYYLNTLLNLKDYSKAESLVKDHQKVYKYDLTLMVDLGYIYSLQANEAKAKSTYQSAIKQLTPDVNQIIDLANAFIVRQLYSYAEQCYQNGEKLLNGSYGFHIDKAQLYYYMRDYDRMITAYLDLLNISSQYLPTVQSRLQQAVYNDIDKSLLDKLKSELIIRINKYPDAVVYSELLIWLFIQENDFESALFQAKALDLRLDENGKRVIALARVAAENNDFNIALQAYKCVLEKGRHLEYYFEARNEMLEVMYKRIILGIDNNLRDYLQMEQAYKDALTEMGTNLYTVDLLGDLAHLQAFYLGKTAEAWLMLEDAVTMPGLNYMQKGDLELELADIYLVDGKVWDATLAYARVEDNNKNNPIGAEAKFRKARLAYFIGNFEWARAQLDVLKASTSKLTANDAADLALFIYENTGWDTIETAMEIYSRADFLAYQSKDSLAILTLDSLINQFPDHAITDEAWFLKGKLYSKRKMYPVAVDSYKYIVDNFYNEILADNALFAMADIYEVQFKQTEQAMELYQQLMVNFPASIYKMEARLRFRQLRGDKVIN